MKKTSDLFDLSGKNHDKFLSDKEMKEKLKNEQNEQNEKKEPNKELKKLKSSWI
jgi:hypothetical protein